MLIFIENLYLFIDIKLIMLSKTQSCEKSVRSKLSDQNGNQNLNKTDKKSQSYLSQKFQQLYSEDKKLRDKRQEMIQQNVRVKQQKEIVGCTFKPEINNNSDYHTTKEPFLQREQNWKRNIEKKITQKREQMSKKQIDGITFMPKITPSPVGSKTRSKKMMKTGYSTKINFAQKKSYRAIHNQRKKFQEIAKNTIVQPFPHRKIPSLTDSNDQINSQQLNPENNREEQVKGLQTSINQQTKQNQPLQQVVKNDIHEQEKHENEAHLDAAQGTEDNQIKEEERKQLQTQKEVQKEAQKEQDIKDVVEQQEEMDEKDKQININHQYQHSNQFDKLNQVEPQNDSIQQGQTVHQ